jgi:hypothetical protein
MVLIEILLGQNQLKIHQRLRHHHNYFRYRRHQRLQDNLQMLVQKNQ